MNTQRSDFGSNPLNQDDLNKSHKLSLSHSTSNSDLNNDMALSLRCYYALFVLMSHGYLQVEHMQNPPEEYAILLSGDVFEYVCKDEFDLLKDRGLITESSTKSYLASEVYEISETGKNHFQVAIMSSRNVICN